MTNTINKRMLTPSAQEVLDRLSENTPMTFKELTDVVKIAPRTVRYALKCLKEKGLITEKFNFKDARQVLYLKKSSTDVSKLAEVATS